MRIIDQAIQKQIDCIRARLTRLEIELQESEPPKITVEEIRLRLAKAYTESNNALDLILEA